MLDKQYFAQEEIKEILREKYVTQIEGTPYVRQNN